MRSGFETWLCLCVVFMSKTLHFHNTSFNSGVLMGGGKLSREAWWNTGGGGGVVVTLWNGETSKSIKSWSVTFLVLMTNSSWKKLFLKYYKFTQFQRKKSHNIKSFDKIKKYTLSQNAFTRKHLPFHWGLVAVIWFLVPSMFPKLHEVMP